MKTVYKAASENTISKHIGNCKKKDGLTVIVLDVSENMHIDDSRAIVFARRSVSRHSIGVAAYVLKHDGSPTAI